MSDDEVIRFEITDYDLDNEFVVNRGRRPNKESQIYGVWAKDSDDDENEDNIRRKVRKPKDFSAPIGFVAGGVQQAGKKKEVKGSEPMEVETAESSRPKFSRDSSDEEDEPVQPHESETAGIRRQGQGMRSVNLGGNVGNWEKHTKGIGAKLLLQMGYEPGKGLGKELQGISAPVEATVRKGRGAIGAYGPEKAAQKAKKEEEKRLKEKEDEDKQSKSKTYHWKKSHKGRYFYKDAADVIQEGKPTIHTINSSELSRVPVIDMTGSEKRVLSGYHALRATAPRFEHEPRRDCRHFALPDLVHNMEVMLETCEQDIIENARVLHKSEDEIVVLTRDLEECDKELIAQDDIIDRVQGIMHKVEMLNRPDLSLEVAYEILKGIKSTYPLEYEMFGLSNIAGTIVSPLFSSLLALWEPLSDPEGPVATFTKWQDLLSTETFSNLVWQHLIPRFEAAADLWSPRSPSRMVRAVSAWSRVVPWVPTQLCAALVVPRLVAAIGTWDPTTDTQPIHTWLLPWHAAAASSLSANVYPLVRSRLSAALVSWHPSDGSARPLLAAWKAAWGPQLTALLHQYIVPTLERTLQVEPIELVGRDTPCVAWQWCLEWLDLLGAPTLASIASRALTPRWLAALAAWLNTNPQHSTVLHSYTQFKKLFPEEILKEPSIRDAFRKALDMMNRSADIDIVEPPPPPRFTITESRESSKISDVLSTITQAKSFSELLELKCVEKGITFVPIPGKTREGRPLYRIGESMQCYVLRNVIMYSNDSGRNFLPISLDKLLRLAED